MSRLLERVVRAIIDRIWPPHPDDAMIARRLRAERQRRRRGHADYHRRARGF